MWATSTVLVKVMARTESAGAIVTYLALFSTPLSFAAAWFVWQTRALPSSAGRRCSGPPAVPPPLHDARARQRRGGAVVPFDYLRLPVVALIAYLAFGESPTAGSGSAAR